MNVILLLADFAQGGPGEKVNALGLGWTTTGTSGHQQALVLLIEFDPDEPVADVTATISLRHASGEAVMDSAGAEISATAQMEAVGVPTPGVPTLVPVTLGVGALRLDPGLYRWEAVVKCGENEQAVRRQFYVRKPEDDPPRRVQITTQA